ncbi:putative kinesin K39 [Planoprotostelium fungivorum]|uniref:Putative kinesin K39 n=1 Tax=Planoprotostelium fungivorum TaxID=1890364 RepID=A0A2P6MUF3_9EUKA|nr:putative kinesin K39 [Planoprotostelium fungivorum]
MMRILLLFALFNLCIAAPKLVFAHYMLWVPANGDDAAGFTKDIQQAQSAGIDGFAINTADWSAVSWAIPRCDKIWDAAEALGTDFKLFFSADMTGSMVNNPNDVINMVSRYHNRTNTLKIDGKVFLSTFVGQSASFGRPSPQEGWQNAVFDPLRSQGIEVYFIPFFAPDNDAQPGGPEMPYREEQISSLIDRFSFVDGLFQWSAWPFFDGDFQTVSGSDDVAYTVATKKAGKSYMAPISPYFSKHGYGDPVIKPNWVFGNYAGAGTYVEHWKQLIKVQPQFVEIITWNDYPERSYIGPTDAWWSADDCKPYPHLAYLNITSYFIQWYKTGSEPQIEKETVSVFYRGSSKDAKAPGDGIGPLQNQQAFSDDFYLVTLLRSPARVTVHSGSATQTFDAQPGLNQFSLPFAEGQQSIEISRDGMNTIQKTFPKVISNQITQYDMNTYTERSSAFLTSLAYNVRQDADVQPLQLSRAFHVAKGLHDYRSGQHIMNRTLIGTRGVSVRVDSQNPVQIEPTPGLAPLQGWLDKKGEKGLVKNYKKRWFQQNGDKLIYYEDPSSRIELGYITLDVFSLDKGAQNDFTFNINCPGRIYQLKADTSTEYGYWTTGLQAYKDSKTTTNSRPESTIDLEDENTKLREKLRHAEGRIQELRDQFRLAATSEGASVNELTEMKKDMVKYRTMADEAQQRAQEMLQEIMRSREEKADFEKKAEMQKEKIRELESSVEILKNNMKTEEQVRAMKEEQNKKDIQFKLTEAEKRAEATAEESRARSTTLEKSVEKLRQENAEKIQAMSLLEKEKDEYRNKKKDRKRESLSINELKNGEIRKLEEELVAIRNTHASVTSRLQIAEETNKISAEKSARHEAELHQKIESISHSHSEAQKRIVDLGVEMAVLTEKLKHSEAQRESQDVAHDELKREKAKLLKSTEQTEQQNVSLKVNGESLSTEIRQLQKSLSQAEEEKNKSEDRMRELERQLRDANERDKESTEERAAEISALKKELELSKMNGDDKDREKEAQFSKLQSDRDQQITYWKAEHHKEREGRETLVAAKIKWEHTETNLRQEIDRANTNQNQLEEKRVELEKRLERSNGELAENSEKITTLEGQIKSTTRQLEEAQSHLQRSQTENNSHAERITLLERENDDLQRRMREQQESTDEMSDKLTRELEEISKMTAQLEAERNEGAEQISDLRRELEEERAKSDENSMKFDVEVLDLRQQLDSTRENEESLQQELKASEENYKSIQRKFEEEQEHSKKLQGQLEEEKKKSEENSQKFGVEVTELRQQLEKAQATADAAEKRHTQELKTSEENSKNIQRKFEEEQQHSKNLSRQLEEEKKKSEENSQKFGVEIVELRQQLETARSSGDDAEQKRIQELKTIEENYKNAQRKFEEEREHSRKLQGQLEEEKTSSEEISQKFGVEATELRQQLEKSRTSAEETEQKLRQDLTTGEENSKNLQRKFEEEQEHSKKLQGQLEEEKKKSEENSQKFGVEVAELRQQLETARSSGDDAEQKRIQELKTIEENYKNAQRKFEEEQEHSRKLQGQLEEEKKKSEENSQKFGVEVAELRQQLETARSSGDDAEQKRIQELKTIEENSNNIQRKFEEEQQHSKKFHDQLEEEKRKSTEAVDLLNQKLSVLENNEKAFQVKVELLEAQLLESKGNDNTEKLLNELESAMYHNHDIEEKLSQREEVVAQLQRDLVQEERDQAKDAYDMLEATNQTQLELLEHSVQQKTEEVQRLSEELQQKTDENIGLQEELDETIRETSEEIAALRGQTNGSNGNHEEEEKSIDKIRSLNIDLALANDELRRSKERNLALENQLQVEESKSRRLSSNDILLSKDREVEAFKDLCREANAEKEKLITRNEFLEEQHLQLEKIVVENQMIKEQLSVLRNENADYREEMEELRNLSISEIPIEVTSDDVIKRTHYVQKVREVDDANLDIEIMTKELVDTREKLSALQERYTEHLGEKMEIIQNLQSEVKRANLSSQISYDDLLSSKDEIHVLKAHNLAMTQQLEGLRDEAASKNSMLSQLKSQAHRNSVSGRSATIDITRMVEKEAALQSHNSFLASELERMELENTVRNETVKRLQSELKESRLGSLSPDASASSRQQYQDLMEQFEYIKTRYFMSTAVGIKVQGSQLGWYANTNLQLLYEKALNLRVPLEQWPEWITEEIRRASKPLEPMTTGGPWGVVTVLVMTSLRDSSACSLTEAKGPYAVISKEIRTPPCGRIQRLG